MSLRVANIASSLYMVQFHVRKRNLVPPVWPSFQFQMNNLDGKCSSVDQSRRRTLMFK